MPAGSQYLRDTLVPLTAFLSGVIHGQELSHGLTWSRNAPTCPASPWRGKREENHPWDREKTSVRGLNWECLDSLGITARVIGLGKPGRQTLEEEAGVSHGAVLLLPEAGEAQEGGGVQVVQHPDHLLPPVALPAEGTERDYRQLKEL